MPCAGGAAGRAHHDEPPVGRLVMNFFSHAWIAAQLRPEPRFVLGAMLPDLAVILGSRFELPAEPVLADGVRLHHATDALFHASDGFRRWNQDGVVALLALELPRGPARGAAHLGVELLLDGVLARAPGPAPGAYQAALAEAGQVSIAWRGKDLRRDLEDLCERLAGHSAASAAADASRLAERIERTLAPRRRLRLAPEHVEPIARWLAATRPRIEAEGLELAETILAALR